MSAITSLLFLGGSYLSLITMIEPYISTMISLSSLNIAIKTTFVVFIIVWFRATLPRLR